MMSQVFKLSCLVALFVNNNAFSPSSSVRTGNALLGNHNDFGMQKDTIFGITRSTRSSSSSSSLFAKKKKRNPNEAKGGKIQVKLTKHVAGTGQAGDVIMVAPAFFENKLKRTQSAVRVSDEEVQAENSEKAAKDKAQRESALEMKGKIEGFSLKIGKKAGPEGHLFGGVGKKMILDDLKSNFPKGALDGKQIKITTVEDGEGKGLKHDIKEVGDYKAKISFLKGIEATFEVSVVAD